MTVRSMRAYSLRPHTLHRHVAPLQYATMVENGCCMDGDSIGY